MSTDFVELTEIAGDDVSREQVERLCRRYYWAGEYCRGKDVLEVACGTGQGIGYLGGLARSLAAGDFSETILAITRKHYGERFELRQFDAQKMPYGARSFDVVIIFEALYYLPDPRAFFAEARRVLRDDGVLLIASANKDLYDFNPSPHSVRYFGVRELTDELRKLGFACEFFGDSPLGATSVRQRILRPVKMLAAKLRLIPQSMNAKKLLKRLVFGRLVRMPAEITAHTHAHVPPVALQPDRADHAHKVIFCAARRVV